MNQTIDPTSMDRRPVRKDHFASKIVQTRAVFGVRKRITRSRVCSTATIAARGVCVFRQGIMATPENVPVTTTSRLKKARINVLDFVSSEIPNKRC
ncbi:hypothetical protein V6N13_095344 [Hibiscus sabdariffa]